MLFILCPFTRTEGDASSRDSLRDSVVFLFDRCESYRLAYSKYLFLLKLQASLTFFKCLFMYTRLCVLRFQNSQTCSADSYHLISRCVYIFPFVTERFILKKHHPHTHTHTHIRKRPHLFHSICLHLRVRRAGGGVEWEREQSERVCEP